MAYGIKIVNSSGSIQIDGTYRNMCLTESDTGLSVYNPGGGGAAWLTAISITSSPLVPLIAVRPNTDYPVGIIGLAKSGSNFTTVYLTTVVTQTTSVDWKLYRQATASSESYGLRIKDASADIVYDTGKNYLKIYSVTSISLPTHSSTQDVSHSGISNPYYILAPQSAGLHVVPQGSDEYLLLLRVGMLKLSSTSVRVGWFVIQNPLVPGGTGTEFIATSAFKLIVCGNE